MSRQRSWRFIAVVVCLTGGLRIGTAKADVQVNTYTPGSQGGASVAMDADGDFVVVWVGWHSPDTDTSGLSVQGQRYAADGSTVGGQFQVNKFIQDDQHSASVAMNAGGDFVVVWESEGSSGTDTWSDSVQGQRYASDGSEVGAQFQINTYTTEEQRWPSVAMGSDGDFVVAWSSEGSSGTDSSYYSIQGQRYASDGSASGGEFQINTSSELSQVRPSVALDQAGNSVVVWASGTSGGTDSSAGSIQGQRYASDGSTLGGEFQVNTYTMDPQTFPSMAMGSDGEFVVVWDSLGSSGTDSSLNSIQGQRYASDGSTLGGEFQVNAYTSSYQRFPAVAMDADGDFFIVWDSLGSSGTDNYRRSVQGQRYASDGSTVGAQLQVNTYTPEGQRYPAVALDADGNFVAVWTSWTSTGTDSSSTSVQMGMELVFADGFESGDTSAWSSLVGDR